jgi:arylsulfatase B
VKTHPAFFQQLEIAHADNSSHWNIAWAVFMKRILVTLSLVFALTAQAAKQNILLIIADDYGVDSSALYNSASTGAQIPPTPTIEALATNGVVFRNAYANPLCSPTRSCIFTGRHGFRTGIGDVVQGAQPPLSATEFTLAKAFSTNAVLGYQTAMFGKWHLGGGPNGPLSIGGWSNYAGNLIGQLSNYYSWAKTSNGTTTVSTNYATTDVVNDATRWITNRGTNAWFAWVAFNAPHSPYHLPPTNLCPHFANLPGTTNDIAAHETNYFAAMIEALDTELGRLLAALPDRTNTHVIFIGDNGSESTVIQQPFPKIRAKDTLYEGGVHVPLIISGPAVVSPGRTNETLAHAVDLFATILEMAGSSTGGIVPPGITLDSQSLMPALQTTNSFSRRAYVELFGSTISNNVAGQALRDDRYKLIRFVNTQQRFYDLLTDPYEATNLLTASITASQQQQHDRLEFALFSYTTNIGPVVASQSFDSGQFSLSVTQAANYALWRCTDLPNGFWSPVTNAVVTTNASVVTLKDIAPPATGAVYGVAK